jgi:mitochondrial fission protein ELM1
MGCIFTGIRDFKRRNLFVVKIWTLTDGHTGMNSQVSGLAEGLGFETVSKKVDRRMPWALLPPTWNWGALQQLIKGSDSLAPPYPDILISAGRRSLPFSLALGRICGKKMIRLHVQDPRINPRHFDHVIVCEHDRLRGPNVWVGAGPLNPINPTTLQEAARIWETSFHPLPRPLTAFLVGGHTNRYRLTQKVAEDLLQAFQGILDSGSGLILLSSFRTPSFLTKQMAAFAQTHKSRVFFYEGHGPNPYRGALALGDFFVVTNDSANMMFEACYTGKPVFTFPLNGHQNTPPFRFSLSLQQSGLVRPFALPFENWTYTPPRETERVVSFLKNHYGWSSS